MDEHANSASGGSVGTASAARMLAARFRIGGALRFLSHAETLRVFQRACARAGIAVRYTSGYNPHPKLSLPLPRTVGVESEDELLVVRLSEEPAEVERRQRCPRGYEEQTQRALQEALPEGIELLAVGLVDSGAPLHARSVEYVFPLRSDRADRLGGRVQALLATESLPVERRLPGERRVRRVDVRPFLESIRTAEEAVTVTCRVTAAGTIRIEEVLQLLELEREALAGPIRRIAVEWVSTPPHGETK